MNNFILCCVALSISALAGYGYGNDHGVKSIQAKWDAEKLALTTAQRTKEAELQSNMDTLRKAYTDETSKLANHVRNLSDSLRSRTERPAVSASATTSAEQRADGCTGAELYKSDSEFLVRVAERADTIRIALIQCQQAYQEASK